MHSERKLFSEHRESVQTIGSFQFSLPVFVDQNKDGVHTATGVQQWVELLPPQQSKQEPEETPKPSLGFSPADHQGAD